MFMVFVNFSVTISFLFYCKPELSDLKNNIEIKITLDRMQNAVLNFTLFL